MATGPVAFSIKNKNVISARVHLDIFAGKDTHRFANSLVHI